jgi:hypothetical protein
MFRVEVKLDVEELVRLPLHVIHDRDVDLAELFPGLELDLLVNRDVVIARRGRAVDSLQSNTNRK